MSGDAEWIEAHSELLGLHLTKSETYGNEKDALANFTDLAKLLGQVPEIYVASRMIEKLIRTLNMLHADRGYEVNEWQDLASLALCGEALRRRRWDEPTSPEHGWF